MKIVVNGTVQETGARTLDDLIEELGRDAATVATAVNGEFAPRAARGGTPLHDGDRVEILAPMQGG